MDAHLQNRALLSIDTPLSPRAELSVPSAELALTWNGIGGWDTIEAVAIDGNMHKCSVDNSAWRQSGGVGTNFETSSCFKLCSDDMHKSTGVGRICMRMKLALGSVYDMLITRKADPSQTKAMRIRTPWVDTGRCVMAQDSTLCGGHDVTWHGSGLMHLDYRTHMEIREIPITPRNRTIGGTGDFSATITRDNLVYLSLDRGMRITRIVTVTTFNDVAISKLKDARSREEVLVICKGYRDCVIQEHSQIPYTSSSHAGWGFEQQQGSAVRASSGVAGSVMWVAEIDQEDCHIEVGSWLLGSIPLNTETKGISALFSSSIARICDSAQAVILVRPGFAWPKLVTSNNRFEWSLMFIELQMLDELGIPIRRG